MSKTAFMRDGSVLQSGRKPVLEEGRPPMLWRRMFFHQVRGPELVDALGGLREGESHYPRGHMTVCDALDLWINVAEDEAPRMALNYFGVTATKILRGKTQWCFPDGKTEGEDAIVVPVGGVAAPLGACLPLLGTHMLRREKAPEDIGDLVAIALSDGRALSFNGTTAAIGAFGANADGGLRIATNGLSWLKRHVVRARKMGEDRPAHLVARMLDLPDGSETLLLDSKPFAFRLDQADCAIPAGTKTIICPDSAALAELIAGELKRRDKLPPAPQVLGPKQ